MPIRYWEKTKYHWQYAIGSTTVTPSAGRSFGFQYNLTLNETVTQWRWHESHSSKPLISYHLQSNSSTEWPYRGRWRRCWRTSPYTILYIQGKGGIKGSYAQAGRVGEGTHQLRGVCYRYPPMKIIFELLYVADNVDYLTRTVHATMCTPNPDGWSWFPPSQASGFMQSVQTVAS